jgi:hypothetical protein
MGADDASSADMHRPSAAPDADPLALDEETVERLLAGDLSPDQAPPGYAEVAALLAATTAAPRPEELAGEAAALAELRAVTRTRPVAIPRRAGRLRRRRRVGLAVVVVVGALAAGGAAAAATGHLPGPVRDAARSILVTVGVAAPAAPTQPGLQPVPSTAVPGSGRAGSGTPGPGPAGATGRGPGSTGAGSVGGPDMAALCQAFMAGRGAERGEKLDAAAFQALAQAAGGSSKMVAYCEDLQPGNAQPDKPQEPPEDRGGPPPSTGGNQERGPPST